MNDSKPSYILGIDLGTTHSLVAIGDSTGARILETHEGERLLPSVVSFDEEGIPQDVGYAARRQKLRGGRDTIYSVKRLLGRSFEEIPSDWKLPYQIRNLSGSPKCEGSVAIEVHGKFYTPTEVSSWILKRLKDSAQKALGVEVSRAVVTVPAYFNDAQRQATRMAGKLAGLEVVRILNEPTAAALAYGVDTQKNGKIVVFDLGGGTFDVSVLQIQDGVFEVLSTSGDTSLGGDDFDRILAEQMLREMEAAEWDREDLAHSELRALVLEAAEGVKKSLSQISVAVFQVSWAGRVFRREISREEMDDWTRPLIERLRAPCEQALRDARVTKEQLDTVCLVGGSTRSIAIRRAVQEIFGKIPDTSLHPDEVVALGAALQGSSLAGQGGDFLLLDVVPLSLGIETYGGVMSTLIERNSKIPTSHTENFTTFVDHQTHVDIHVLQGERPTVAENQSLARFRLGPLEPLPAGMPRISVKFLIDADGILQVSARDLRTGLAQAMEVKPSLGWNPEQIESHLKVTEIERISDQRKRREVEVRMEAERVLRQVEKRLPEGRLVLSPEEVTKVEARVATLRSALAQPFGSADLLKIQEARYALNDGTVRMAEQLLARAMEQARQKSDKKAQLPENLS